MRRFIALTTLLLMAAAPLPAEALRVSHRGPRSTTAAMHLRAAFRGAGLTDATISVHIRRAPRRWRVTVRVQRKGRTVLVRRMRLRRGRLTRAIARSIARAA
ncbi:MAG: hypothetical protein KC503_02445, partial [Myxococcales bacterium]|nr:hypothetical protein [Myxococcales bacterium]